MSRAAKVVVDGSTARDDQLAGLVDAWVKAASDLDDPYPSNATVPVPKTVSQQSDSQPSTSRSICNFAIRLISYGLAIWLGPGVHKDIIEQGGDAICKWFF